jgi:hypothetical protein
MLVPSLTPIPHTSHTHTPPGTRKTAAHSAPLPFRGKPVPARIGMGSPNRNGGNGGRRSQGDAYQQLSDKENAAVCSGFFLSFFCVCLFHFVGWPCVLLSFFLSDWAMHLWAWYLVPVFPLLLHFRHYTHLTGVHVFHRFLTMPTTHAAFLQTPGDGVGGAIYTPVDEISRLPITIGRPDYEQYFSQIEGCVHCLTVRLDHNATNASLVAYHHSSPFAAHTFLPPQFEFTRSCSFCIRPLVSSPTLFTSLVLPVSFRPKSPSPPHHHPADGAARAISSACFRAVRRR